MEAFSVLTRLPPPHRAPAEIAATFLEERFPEAPLILPARRHLEFVGTFAKAGITGGAVYDALVGVTAKGAGATLLTRDLRASTTYDRLNVRYELVS